MIKPDLFLFWINIEMYRPVNAGIGYTTNYSQSMVQTRTIELSKPTNKYRPLTGGPIRRQRVVEESLLKKDVLTPIVRVTELPPATVEQRAVLVKQPDGSYKSEAITSQRNNQPSDKLLMLHQPAPSSMRHRSLVAPPKLATFNGDWSNKAEMSNFLIKVGVFPANEDINKLPKSLLRDKIVMYNQGIQQGGGIDVPAIRENPDKRYFKTNTIGKGETNLKRFETITGTTDKQQFQPWVISASPDDIKAAFETIFRDPRTNKPFSGAGSDVPTGDMRRLLYTLAGKIKDKKSSESTTIGVRLSSTGQSKSKSYQPVTKPKKQGSVGSVGPVGPVLSPELSVREGKRAMTPPPVQPISKSAKRKLAAAKKREMNVQGRQ